MKRFAILVFTMVLAVSMSFAQTSGDTKTVKPQNPTESNKTAPTTKPQATSSGKKGHKGGKKGHKGGKKSKKGTTTTTPPK
jgi:hypothetical protein